jgi:hypothetical protein
MFLSLFTTLSIGGAVARDLPAISTERLSYSPSSDINDPGVSPPQYSRGPEYPESQAAAASRSSLDTDLLAAHAQYVPSALQRPVYIPPQYFAATSTFDADSIGNRSVTLDGTVAPFGIYQNGVRLRATGVASWYEFLANANPRQIATGHYLEGGLLVGYGVWAPGFNINWYAGPAFGEGVNQGTVTDRWGVKAVIDMNARPTDITMVSASVTYSTIGNNLQVQAKTGVKVFGDIYFGPEAKFTWQKILPWQVNFSSGAIATTTPVSPQENISTIRVGGHISALTIGPVLFGVSGGWAHDHNLGNGYYGSVWFYQPF